MELQRDLQIANGEKERDTNDRKDRDNYFTQKTQALQRKYLGVAQTGKDLNDIKERLFALNTLRSKYNQSVDEDGKVVTDRKPTAFTPKPTDNYQKEKTKQEDNKKGDKKEAPKSSNNADAGQQHTGTNNSVTTSNTKVKKNKNGTNKGGTAKNKKKNR
jgi:hypothetical protein